MSPQLKRNCRCPRPKCGALNFPILSGKTPGCTICSGCGKEFPVRYKPANSYRISDAAEVQGRCIDVDKWRANLERVLQKREVSCPCEVISGEDEAFKQWYPNEDHRFRRWRSSHHRAKDLLQYLTHFRPEEANILTGE